MDSREIADKIKLGEEQLAALKETLSASDWNCCTYDIALPFLCLSTSGTGQLGCLVFWFLCLFYVPSTAIKCTRDLTWMPKQANCISVCSMNFSKDWAVGCLERGSGYKNRKQSNCLLVFLLESFIQSNSYWLWMCRMECGVWFLFLQFSIIFCSQDIVVSVVTRPWTGHLRSLILLHSVQPPLEPIQPPIQWAAGVIFTGVRWPRAWIWPLASVWCF